MEVAILAVKYLGTALISLTIGFVVCFLAVLGYNTYIRFHSNKKKIEVSTQNSTSISNPINLE